LICRLIASFAKFVLPKANDFNLLPDFIGFFCAHKVGKHYVILAKMRIGGHILGTVFWAHFFIA
jgi:hypothetical protein